MPNALRDNLMVERRDWNRRGPNVPAWFRRRLAEIDPKLVLQFIPAGDDGASPLLYPLGVWTICRRLRKSRFLFKQWTWAITKAFESNRKQANVPKYSALRLIRMARNNWRNGDVMKLQRSLDRSLAAFKAARETKLKNKRADQIMSRLRECDLSKRRLGAVSMVSMAGPSGKQVR